MLATELKTPSGRSGSQAVADECWPDGRRALPGGYETMDWTSRVADNPQTIALPAHPSPTHIEVTASSKAPDWEERP
jgi:hypothetical protein